MMQQPQASFLFDLDGTLVDSVYQHVLAWREALEKVGIETAAWTIHRRIGMSGGLMANAVLRETGRAVDRKEQALSLRRFHTEAYSRLFLRFVPLPGTNDLLKFLTDAKVPWLLRPAAELRVRDRSSTC